MKQKNVMRGLAGLSWLKKEMERAIPFILIRNFPLFRI